MSAVNIRWEDLALSSRCFLHGGKRMSMEIRGVTGFDPTVANLTNTRALPNSAVPQPDPQPQKHQVEKTISELQTISSAFDRRLEYTVNRDLNRVIVKVIDTKTDKVIRELPPKELQDLYKRIREAIGLLFDKKA